MILSDVGSTIVTQVIKEVADVLEITLEHATTQLAQIIGKLDTTHVSFKKRIKV